MSCVKGKDSLTDVFRCSRGVRQGCLLSPLLFALFLNDLHNKLREESEGVDLGDESIHSLLYADDLILIARNPKDLQAQLDVLERFTNSINMEVNMGKTKVMVLRNNKHKSRAKPENLPVWYLGGKEVEECESYKYLGVTIKSNGSFSEHVEKVKEKAQKCYFSLLGKNNEWGGFQPRLFLFLFDHTIMPILNYASEVWGISEQPILERLHLKACKYALGVKSTTSTDAVYPELGRISVLSNHHVNILKFFNRLINLDCNRYANKALIMLINDADLGYNNWVSAVRSLQELYNVTEFDSKSEIKNKVRRHFESVAMENLRQQIVLDKKMKSFATFKNIFKSEAYLDIIDDFATRSSLAKLRLSAHNLQIEVGRFAKPKIPRSERYCLYCKSLGSNEAEDEIHFTLSCTLFCDERKGMLNEINNKFPSTTLLSTDNLYIWLMSQEDNFCIKLLAEFIRNAFSKREKNLHQLLTR